MKEIDKIFENRFITIYGIKREIPNEFTKLADARDEAINEFRKEFYKTFKIPELVEWLYKILTKLFRIKDRSIK